MPGKERTAIASTKRESAPAASLMCSVLSAFITAPSWCSRVHDSLPTDIETACPPSCAMPTWNETRVRSDGLKNTSATLLPFSGVGLFFDFFKAAAFARIVSSSFAENSRVLMNDLPFKPIAQFLDEKVHVRSRQRERRQQPEHPRLVRRSRDDSLLEQPLLDRDRVGRRQLQPHQQPQPPDLGDALHRPRLLREVGADVDDVGEEAFDDLQGGLHGGHGDGPRAERGAVLA